jgi:hypothetical protein
MPDPGVGVKTDVGGPIADGTAAGGGAGCSGVIDGAGGGGSAPCANAVLEKPGTARTNKRAIVRFIRDSFAPDVTGR